MYRNRSPKGRKLPDSIQLTHSTMRDFMLQGKADPVLRQLTARVLSDGVAPRDRYPDDTAFFRARCRAIWQWVRDNIAYTNDGWDERYAVPDEVVRDVENIIRDRAGDCDDHTILVGAMLLSNFEGPPLPSGRMAAPIEVYMWGQGDTPTHIFPVAVCPDGHKYAMDTTGPPRVGGFNVLPGFDAATGRQTGNFWECNFFGPHVDNGGNLV